MVWSSEKLLIWLIIHEQQIRKQKQRWMQHSKVWNNNPFYTITLMIESFFDIKISQLCYTITIDYVI